MKQKRKLTEQEQHIPTDLRTFGKEKTMKDTAKTNPYVIAEKQKRIKIEITNRVNGILEQGGVCGRILSYPLDLVARILERDPADLLSEDPEDLADAEVPGYVYSMRLWDYLDHYHSDQVHVINRGHIIQ